MGYDLFIKFLLLITQNKVIKSMSISNICLILTPGLRQKPQFIWLKATIYRLSLFVIYALICAVFCRILVLVFQPLCKLYSGFFTFILTFIALAITTYKSIFTKTEVTNTDAIEAIEDKLEAESMQELEDLDIEIDESELEDIPFDE